jgi:hypothetical protein
MIFRVFIERNRFDNMAMTRQERINSQKKQYRIDSVKQAFKDDISIPSKSISLLRDRTGGTICKCCIIFSNKDKCYIISIKRCRNCKIIMLHKNIDC